MSQTVNATVNAKKPWIGYTMLFSILILSILGALSLNNLGVVGTNATNVTTKVNVTNTEPNITAVWFNPNPLTLTPGNTTNFTCFTNVTDFNGENDFYNVTATIFHTTHSSRTQADDNNNHYTVYNSSCKKDNSVGSATEYQLNCTANIQYYADNGTWACFIRVWDNGGAHNPDIKINSTKTSDINATIETLLALDVPNELDYGNLTVTQISAEKEFNITNYGNIQMNVSIRGFSQRIGDNLSMNCAQGTIPLVNQRFSTTQGTVFNSMTPLTNSSINITDWSLYQRSNDANFGNDRNQTYWKLHIPLGVGGDCNGTLLFSAYAGNTS